MERMRLSRAEQLAVEFLRGEVEESSDYDSNRDNAPLVGRDHRGRWLPGFVTNPGGRPKKDRGLVEMCRIEAPANVRTLCEIRDNPREDTPARLMAIKMLLEYGFGRPPQSLAVRGGGPDENGGVSVVVISGVDANL